MSVFEQQVKLLALCLPSSLKVCVLIDNGALCLHTIRVAVLAGSSGLDLCHRC